MSYRYFCKNSFSFNNSSNLSGLQRFFTSSFSLYCKLYQLTITIDTFITKKEIIVFGIQSLIFFFTKSKYDFIKPLIECTSIFSRLLGFCPTLIVWGICQIKRGNYLRKLHLCGVLSIINDRVFDVLLIVVLSVWFFDWFFPFWLM